MILRLLSLLASLCFSQSQNNQLPIPNLQSPQAQQVIQNALNQKFSVFGGTVANTVNMSTATVSQLCFSDGTCQTTSGGAGAPFWAITGSDIHNTNSGQVNLVGPTLNSNIATLKTTSTTWTWAFQNPATAFASNPFLALTDNNNGGLTFGFLDIPGGQRMMLWDETQPLRKLNSTGLYPALGIFGDIEIGDIHAIATNPMTYFMRVESNVPYTSCTQLFSAKAVNNDTDGGAGIVYCPSDNAHGAVNDGTNQIIAYGTGSGTKANEIEFKNRVSAGTVQELSRINSNGYQQEIGGIYALGADPVAISSSTTLDWSAGVGRWLTFGNGSYLPLQIGSNNGTTTRTIVTVDGANQEVGILKGTPQSTLDVQGTASFGSTTQSTFTATGALTINASGSLTIGNIASGTQCLHVNGSGLVSGTGADCVGATNPGGSNTDVQFNNSGAFGGSNNFTWDNTNSALTITSPGTSVHTINITGQNSSNAPMIVTQSGGTGATIYTTSTGGNQVYINAASGNNTSSWILQHNAANKWQVGSDGSTGTEGQADSFFWFNNTTGANAFNIRSNDSRAHFVGSGGVLVDNLFDANGTSQFGTAPTKSTFTTTGSLTMPSGATITDLANVGNTVLVTNSGSQYTSLPLLGAGGIIIGTNLYPSTGTVTGSNGINITTATAPSAINVAAAQNIASGASPTFTGTNFTGIPLSGLSVAASSYTTNGFTATFTNTTFQACITTITVTTNGNTVEVGLSASAANSVVGNLMGMNILMDGNWPAPLNNNKGTILLESIGAAVPNDTNVGFKFFTTPSAASHSFCLQPRVNAGTGSWDTSNETPTFYVKEIK